MKEVSLWTVRWTKTSRPFYGVPKDDHGLIPLEENIVRFNMVLKIINSKWKNI